MNAMNLRYGDKVRIKHKNYTFEGTYKDKLWFKRNGRTVRFAFSTVENHGRNLDKMCITCTGTGYYLCNRGVVGCHVCNGTGKVKL